MHARATWFYHLLDIHPMQFAAQHLLGEQDFTSFRSIECQSKTPMRHIHHLNVERHGDWVSISLTANAFLHHMVRNIAGVLMAVGSGKKTLDWVHEVLEAKDRRLGAETAPPYGLYLVDVTYPEQFGLNQKFLGPLLVRESAFDR